MSVAAGSAATAGAVTATDVDLDPALNHPVTDEVTFALDTTGTKGTVSNFNTKTGTFDYTPGVAQQPGTDTFMVTATDLSLASATSTVTVTVTNNEPVAASDEYGNGKGDAVTVNTGAVSTKIISGQAYYLNVVANDNDGDTGAEQTLTIQSLTQPAQGGLVEVTGDNKVKFTSTPGYAGDVTFTYVVNDGYGGTPPPQPPPSM